MKLLLFVSALIIGPVLTAAETQFVTVTQKSGVVAFAPTDIIQIVGAVASTNRSPSVTLPTNPAALRIVFSDGAIILNRICSTDIEEAYDAHVENNPVLGSTLTGVASLQISGGTGAVTVKVLKQAAEFVSDPVMLPVVNDGTYEISLETSVDMNNWAPAAPGDYLGSTSHRFFRVKAVKKVAAP